jgi:hypothetical protein
MDWFALRVCIKNYFFTYIRIAYIYFNLLLFFLACIPYFKQVGLCNHAVCVYIPHPLSNGWTSFYEKAYISWHLSPSHGVLHKSFSSVCVYICIPLLLPSTVSVKKRYYGNVYTSNNRNIVDSFPLRPALSKKSRRLDFPRTSCFAFKCPSFFSCFHLNFDCRNTLYVFLSRISDSWYLLYFSVLRMLSQYPTKLSQNIHRFW